MRREPGPDGLVGLPELCARLVARLNRLRRAIATAIYPTTAKPRHWMTQSWNAERQQRRARQSRRRHRVRNRSFTRRESTATRPLTIGFKSRRTWSIAIAIFLLWLVSERALEWL